MTPKQKTNNLILDPHITGCSKCLNKPGLFTNADSVYTTAWLGGWVVFVTSSSLSHNPIFSIPIPSVYFFFFFFLGGGGGGETTIRISCYLWNSIWSSHGVSQFGHLQRPWRNRQLVLSDPVFSSVSMEIGGWLMSPVQDTEDIHAFTYYPIYFNDGNINHL